jgi:diguanylate cyclase
LGQIRELTKNTLTKLKEENKNTLPSNYFIEFKKQASLSGIEIEEFELFDKIKDTLTNDEKKSNEIQNFKDLATILAKRVSSDELKKLIYAFDEILKPSIDFTHFEDIENFIAKTLNEPKNIITDTSINELKEISKNRVNKDRRNLKDKTDDIVKLTSLMSRYFDKTLSDSENSTDEIMKIKDELITLNISNASQRELKIVQSKLIDTIYKIENSIQINKTILKDNKERFSNLHKQIEELQKELLIAKEEKETDFLTNILNRRAYHHEIEKMEKKYSMFENNYAIIFYDIDFFKNINDIYGHTCGDAVLKNFASILKRLTRKEDVIARYGGEEFIALVNYEEEIEIQRYIKRVKETITSTNFIYKKNNIPIRFSAGVTFRKDYESYLDAKKKADELLYQAKHKGRDKIIFDNGIEF